MQTVKNAWVRVIWELILRIRKYFSVINAILHRNNMFDPYKFDYKAYILERYNLTESPTRIRDIEYTKNNALLNNS